MVDLARQSFTAPNVVTPDSLHLVSGRVQAPNSVEGTDPVSVWLAPDRVLVVGWAQPAVVAGGFASDITDAQVVFRLTGPHCNDVLAMGTSLDPALLAPGRCAQTLFAGVRGLLYRHGDAVCLHVDRPLARFVADWLAQAATAFEGATSP